MGNENQHNYDIGLVNLGYSCYMNSALQCLATCSLFQTAIIKAEYSECHDKHKRTLLSSLQEVFKYLNPDPSAEKVEHKKLSKSHLQNIRDMLYKICDKYKHKKKSDSPEFTSDLLSVLISLEKKDNTPFIPSTEEIKENYFINQSAYNDWKKLLNVSNSRFVDLFYGQVQCEFKCINELCKGDIKEKMIYDQFLLLDVPIPNICTIEVSVVFRTKVETINVRIDGNVLMFYLKYIVMKKIEDGILFRDEDIKEKKVGITIVTISKKHMKNLHVHDNEEEHVFIINQEENKKKRIVAYVNLFNENEIQYTNHLKYLFISKKKDDFNEIPYLYILNNDTDIQTFYTSNNLNDIINEKDQTQISSFLSNSTETLLHIEANNNGNTSIIIQSSIAPQKQEEISVEDCLLSFSENQRNRTKCKYCKHLYKTCSFITKPPHYLMVYLKRFYQDKGEIKKNSNKITFKETLDLSPYSKLPSSSSSLNYNLISINQHVTKFVGLSEHYTAKVFRHGKWFLCDDNNIDFTNYNDDFEHPLVLFYERSSN